jgi:hypothetical protein
MKVIAFIEKPDVIKKILKHLDLWHVKRKPRPLAHAPPGHTRPLFDESSGPSAEDLIIGHTHSKRVRPDLGRCSVLGPVTSWDTHYNSIQLEKAPF